MTFAIRSGISIASGYAIKTLSTFMEKIPERERLALERSKSRLQTKIMVITPAIDLIELMYVAGVYMGSANICRSARGNTSLESTFQLTRELKKDIDTFEEKIEEISSSLDPQTSTKRAQAALSAVKEYVNDLLFRIEEAIPLISLALTTSGANLSARMPDSVSPGRFLQAGNYVMKADEKYESLVATGKNPSNTPIRVQVGPSFNLVLYTIFYGTIRNPHLASSSDITWKEEHARCRVRLWRVNDLGAVSLNDINNQDARPVLMEEQLEYQYIMTVEESFKDGRYHESDESPQRRAIDISTVTRLFFSASGKLLQIEESKSPVLVLKLNTAFDPLRNLTKADTETESGELSDPEDESFIYEQTHQHMAASTDHVEWLAFEQYTTEELAEDLESEESSTTDDDEEDTSLMTGLRSLDISNRTRPQSTPGDRSRPQNRDNLAERGSLSLLEYLIRVAALQCNDQDSIYNIHDERIALYLRDESATGSNAGAPSSASKDSPVRATEAPGLPRNRRRSNMTPGGTSIRQPTGSSSEPKSAQAGRRMDPPPHTPVQFPAIQKKPSAEQQQAGTQEPSAVSTPLTPWEKDRLKMRRQLLLVRKGEGDIGVSANSPIARRVMRNVARTKVASERKAAGLEVGEELEEEDEDGKWGLTHESPLKAKSRLR